MTPLQLIHQELKQGNYYPHHEAHISIWSPKIKRNIYITQQNHTITIETHNPYHQTILTTNLNDPTSIEKIEQTIKEWT